jgi:hypothetical protein
MNKLLWRLFGKSQDYTLYMINRDFKREQRWERIQWEWRMRRETISWVTAFVVAIIIAIIAILVVRAVVQM